MNFVEFDMSSKTISRWCAAVTLCAATSLSMQSAAHAAQNCVAGTWQSPPNSYWDSTNGSMPVQAESAHFQIRWPASKPTLFSQQEAATALKFFESLFTWFTGPTVNWPEPFCDSATKDKVQIFTDEGYPLTGSGGGPRSQAMWVDQWRVKDGSANRGWSRIAMTHEFTHTMQYSTRGLRNSSPAAWLWESHAQFMAYQYPDNDDKVGDTRLTAWMPHLYGGNTLYRYTNWQFWDYLKDKYGFAAVNNIWVNSVGQDGQDPFVVLMRNQGWSVARLGDEFGQFAMKNVNWDYIDAQDGFNRGAAFRDAYGKNTDMKDWLARLRLAKLEPIDVSKRRFVVSKYFAPQRFGYNLVRLIPDTGATSIAVNFRGVVQAAVAPGAELGSSGALQPATVPNPASNWRWGVVAIDKNGNSRSSPMQKGVSADMSFALQTGDQEVYLVVTAAPDEFQSIFADQRYHTIYRYPYKVQLTGAWPDGYQPGFQLATAQKYPAGHIHSYGGGWVGDSATVDATAYVGPFAAVLGGSVLGNARIEDYAAIWNGTVKDNAVVGGLTQICDAVTASGNAEIRSVVACNFEWWDTVITGNAKFFGDLFVHLGGTTATTGAYSGAVYGGTLSQPELGSTKTALPVEVNAAIPPGWPSWVKAGVGVSAIAAGSDGTTLVINSANNSIWKYIYDGGWNQVPGTMKSLAVIKNNSYFGIGLDNNVYRFDGTKWIRVGVAASSIAAGSDGTVLVTNSSTNTIRKYVADNWWTRVKGTMKAVAVVKANSYYGIGTDSNVYMFNGTDWVQIGTAAASIAASADGSLMVTNNASKAVWSYLANGGWSNISLLGVPTGKFNGMAIVSSDRYFGLSDDATVYRH